MKYRLQQGRGGVVHLEPVALALEPSSAPEALALALVWLLPIAALLALGPL